MAGLSSLISLLRAPLTTTHPNAFCHLSEQQTAEILSTSIEVAWLVTAGLGVRVLILCFADRTTKKISFSHSSSTNYPMLRSTLVCRGFKKYWLKAHTGADNNFLPQIDFLQVCLA
ncbi:hypothetical protein AVEN_150614-1 [Araneus ventricosus]|uniref:Uncharacterized protein n=1 Tax=Araneus ventricosus TaxID=182803 RepID=A0A4Y2SWX4_ARAVE|nr:hypothetical protein AVEN_150614-1 [Araneus ventricosus]